MASKITDPLTNAIATSAQAGLSKSGGYGNRGGFGNFLNILAPALAAAFPGGPLPQALNAGNQAVNVMGYNKYLQDTAKAAQQYEQQQEAAKQGDRAGVGTMFGLKNYSGAADLPDAATLQNVMRLNQNQNNQEFLDTGRFSINPQGYVDPSILQDLMKRTGIVNDSSKTLQALPEWMFDPATYTKPGDTSGMDNTPMNVQMLQANAAKEQAVTPGEAFMYGAADPSTLLTGRKNEQGNTIDVGKLTELTRSNKADEANARIQADAAMLHSKKYQPGGGGGSGNPYTIPNAQQEYLNKQVSAIDKELKQYGVIDEHGEIRENKLPKDASAPLDILGMKFGGNETDNSPKARRIRALLEKRAVLSGGGAFGGTGQQKLIQAGQSMGAGVPSVKDYFKNRNPYGNPDRK